MFLTLSTTKLFEIYFTKKVGNTGFCKQQQLIFNLSKPIRARTNLVLSGYVMHLSFWFTNRPSKRSEFSNFILTDAVNSVDYYQWVVRKKFEQVELNLDFLQFEQFKVKSLLWQLIDGDLDRLQLYRPMITFFPILLEP